MAPTVDHARVRDLNSFPRRLAAELPTYQLTRDRGRSVSSACKQFDLLRSSVAVALILRRGINRQSKQHPVVVILDEVDLAPIAMGTPARVPWNYDPFF